MKKIKYISYILCLLGASACQHDWQVENPTEDGVYTITASMNMYEVGSRAQIELGNPNEEMEYFFWNKADRFTVYQPVNGSWSANEFSISSDYNEEEERKAIADFNSDDRLVPLLNYVAIYPYNVTQQDGRLTFSLQNELDFTSATSPEAKENVWKQYLSDNMFMLAQDTVKESGRTYAKFQHLCSMARITYVNQTSEKQQINAVQMGGDQCFGTVLSYDLSMNGSMVTEASGALELSLKGFSVASGETVDFYLFFFPEAFADGRISISFLQPSGTKTLELDTKDISNLNNHATAFQAGKRYWFDVTDSSTGLDWSKNKNLKDGILIENKEFSQALYEALGDYRVVLNEDGYAQITQRHADELSVLNLEGISCTVTTLEGIELFQNLRQLNCNQVGLKECDLSRNVLLNYVELDNNQLESLDFSKNPELRTLSCNGNKELTSLNLSACQNLYELHCNHTSLTSLQLANPKRLSELDYSYTPLSIDFSELGDMLVLNCSGHDYKNINLSEKQQSYLQKLYCSSCQISRFDLDIYKNLRTLDCHDNLLDKLDISSHRYLNEFYCGQQQQEITMQLTVNDSQMENWEKTLKNDSRNERVSTQLKPNTGGSDFGNGGEY